MPARGRLFGEENGGVPSSKSSESFPPRHPVPQHPADSRASGPGMLCVPTLPTLCLASATPSGAQRPLPGEGQTPRDLVGSSPPGGCKFYNDRVLSGLLTMVISASSTVPGIQHTCGG